MSVITATNFDAKKLSVSDIKKLDNGSSQVYINYDGRRLRIQAPRMSLPYNASDYQGNQKYKTQLAMRDMESNPKIKAYFNMLEAVDNFVIDQATKNAGKWFKMSGASRDTIRLFMSSSIHYSRNKETGAIVETIAPTHNVSLRQRNGVFSTELYDAEKRPMEGVTPLDVLRQHAEVTAIIDASSIWVADKKFGISWALHQAVINKPGNDSASGCQIVDEDEDASNVPVVSKQVSADEEDDLMAAVMPAKAAPKAAAPKAPEPVEEDEDVDEDEVVPPPPVPKPVAAPVKKVVKKVAKA